MKKLFGSVCLALLLNLPAWGAVDLNSATQSELEAVRGIGPAKAKAIIEYRQKHGPYQSVDDLVAVKGLGKASVDKLRDQLEVRPRKAAGQ